MADRSGRTRRKQAAPPRGAGKAADTGDALRRAPVRETCETRIAQRTVASYWIRMSESRMPCMWSLRRQPLMPTSVSQQGKLILQV